MIIADAFSKFKAVAWFIPGFVLWAAYPPMGEVTDCLFALAPLLWLSRQGDPRAAAKRWFQSGAFYWVATLSWMPAIIKNEGPWPLVVLGWFVLAAYCAAYFAMFGWLGAAFWKWAKRSGECSVGRRLLGILIVEPVLWCGLELVRSRLFGGFAWNQLGVVPANAGFGAPAALGGVYLLSAVVLLVNGTIAGIAERLVASVRQRMKMSCDVSALSRWRSLETFLVFGLLWALYQGAAAVRPVAAEPAPDALKVALVQRNFPCCFKAREESPYLVYSNLLANVSLLNPDLVVLPESALSEFGALNRPRASSFARWVSHTTGGAALLAGGDRMDAERRMYNSAALYAGGDQLSIYDKVHLVPFGEFIPGDKLMPVLQRLAPVGSCTPGEPRLLELPRDSRRIPLGVAICYEDTDSALVRTFAATGAEMLVFITNDSWFSHSNEALAHAWQATARAIETGLPVVRVGNSGVSGTIQPDGRTTWMLGSDGRPLVDRAGTMFDRVEIRPSPVGMDGRHRPRTPYVRLGDWPLGLAFALLITLMIMVKYTTYKNRREFTDE